MSDHPNLERAREGYMAFAEGDMDAVSGLMADDIVWHVPGDHRMSGDYQGKQEVLGFFGRLMQETGGTFRNDVHDLLANDEHGVALVQSSASMGGKTVEDRGVHVFHMRDGKMTEFWNMPGDQSAWDDFWS